MWQACKCARWLLCVSVSVGFYWCASNERVGLWTSADQNLVQSAGFWQAAVFSVCVCVCGVYRIRVSIEPAEPAKPSMTHSHMVRVNQSKMVGLHRVSAFVSFSRSSFCTGTSIRGRKGGPHRNLNHSSPVWLVM